MNPVSAQNDRLYIIDLLRFIAAFGVTLYHFAFHQWALENSSPVQYPELADAASYGCLAVPLFFIISGFVITCSMHGKTAREFAWGRFVRLYPTFWICMLATFVIVNHWGPLQAHQNAPSFLANLTMVPHLFHREYVDAPYWTLQVEIRFYVLMFGLLVIRRGNLLVPFAAGWLALSTLDWFHKIPVLHVNLALDHAPFFAAGMIFSAIYRRGWKGTDGALLMGAYLLGCHRVVADLEEDIAGHGWPISTTVITISLAAFFVLFAAISLRKLALQKPRFWVTALGGITYPLYLLHNNIGMTLFNRWQPMMNRWVLLTVLLVGFISVAFVIWYFFERPVLRSLQGWRKRRRTPLAPNSDPSHAPLTNN